MEVLRENQTKGFVSVEYPERLHRVVLAAHESWKAFCALDMSDKMRFSNDDRVNDFGYMFRCDDGDTADFKEQFHVRQIDLVELRQRSLGVPPEALLFIEACEELITQSQGLVRRYAAATEADYVLPGLADNVVGCSDRWVFRFLHYLGGEVLAHPHADRGGFTCHLHETCPGGEYLNQSGEWKDWEIGTGKTIIFPSMVLQHMTRCANKALWHRVIAKPDARDRYAMVAFINFSHTHRYDDSSQRIADLPIGCTYTMPFCELEKLFVPVER